MEVKIKQGNEMLDATIEMVEGVMVVSPKEVKFKPKYGDDYYTPIFNNTYFEPFHCSWTESASGNARDVVKRLLRAKRNRYVRKSSPITK